MLRHILAHISVFLGAEMHPHFGSFHCIYFKALFMNVFKKKTKLYGYGIYTGCQIGF